MNIQTIYEGNIGVNKNNPQYPLDISGSVKFTTIRDTNNNIGSSGQVLSSTGNGLSWTDVSGGGGSGSTSIVVSNDTTDTTNFLTFVNNPPNGTSQSLKGNSNLIYDAFNNRVGIGTATPSATLDVSGTGRISGNFTVDDALFVDASNNRVGVGTIGPQATLSIGGATGQLNHYVYNTTTTSPFNTWFRVAQFSNFTDRTDINLSISTRAGGAIGLTKVSITSTGTIKADWRNVNNQYCLQGVRLATESGITYLEVLTNLVDISGWTITTSYITGSNFTPLEFTSTTGSVASNTFLFANYGSVNGGSFVSTLSNYNYNILTDSIERMRVTSTGNVGIGKTNPQTTLDISGNLLVSSNVLGQNAPLFVDVSNNRVGIAMRAQNPAAPLHVQSDINNSTQVIISGGGSQAHTNRGLRIATHQTSSSDAGVTFDAQFSSGEFLFQTAGVNKMSIKNNGNVGIGTTTPANILDVRGITRITNDDGVSMFYVNWVNSTGNSPTILNSLIGSGGGYGELQTRGSIQTFYTSTNERMRIESTGNVGIGTSTPSEKLNISGGNMLMNGSFDGVLMNPGTGAGSLAITRGGTFTNNVQQINAPYTDNIGGSSGGGAQISLLKDEMTFSTYPNTGTLGNPITLTERMRIKSTGVGINTTNPVYKLQVEGSGTANEVVAWFNNQGAFSSSIAVRQAAKTAYITNHSGSGTPNYDGQVSDAISFGVSSGASPIQFWNGNTGVGSRGTAKMTILTNGNVGIGTNAPTFQLQLSTDSAAKPTSNTWTISSDQRVKTNIENADLDRCNEIVENLSLKRFQWSEKYFPNVSDRNSIGFIAQEVEQYFPNAVKTHKNKFLLQKGETEEENIYEEIEDFKSLDIDQLIKCLFGSVKYLQNQVKTLEERIAKLE